VRLGLLDTTLLTGGELIPLEPTEVTCDVEDVTDSDGTMILTVLEKRARMKKGDELFRLDPSELAEVARQQEISVERSLPHGPQPPVRSSLSQAKS
jgi:hypothetical protein